MKTGFRTPSPKRSFKARTTGRAKRTIKQATNPFYGKKGPGLITDPKKAVYNKVYNKTTVVINDVLNHSQNTSAEFYSDTNNEVTIHTKKQRPRWLFYFYMVITIFILGCDIFMVGLGNLPVWCILVSIVCIAVTIYYGITTKKTKENTDEKI